MRANYVQPEKDGGLGLSRSSAGDTGACIFQRGIRQGPLPQAAARLHGQPILGALRRLWTLPCPQV